jgi:hypothetical protein
VVPVHVNGLRLPSVNNATALISYERLDQRKRSSSRKSRSGVQVPDVQIWVLHLHKRRCRVKS